MTSKTAPQKGEAAANSLAGKYLTFSLQNESFGITVLKIREIIQFSKITVVPQMPDYICGVINLRGKIIPVLALGRRLGFEQAADIMQKCIVVVQIRRPDGKDNLMGLVVDEVEEVMNIAAADIEPTPHFGPQISTEFILGMAKSKTGVKTLLNIDRVVGIAATENTLSAV